MIKVICKQCGKEFEVYPSDIKVGRGKFHSPECFHKSRKGIPTWNKDTKGICKATSGSFQKGHLALKTAFQKGNTIWLGKKHTEETKIKMMESHKELKVGNDLYNWKGNDVSYSGLHHWVYRWLGKPTKCEHCGKDGLTGCRIHWANKSGNYLRNLNDWIRLCALCHKKYDKKYNLLKNKSNG